MPKYMQIAKAIQEFIAEKKLTSNQQIPIIVDLMDQFNVSKSTIIKALEVLELRGLIYQRRRSGSFVRATKRPTYFNLAHQSGIGKNLEGAVLSLIVIGVTKIQANEEIAKNLLIETGDSVFRVKRVTTINNLKSVYELSYYNASVIPYLDEEIAEKSIFAYIKSEYNVGYAFSDSYFVLEEADELIAGMLDLKSGDLTMKYEEIFYSNDGIAFDYSVSYYHPQAVRFYSTDIPRR